MRIVRRQILRLAPAALLLYGKRAWGWQTPGDVPWLEDVQRVPKTLPEDAPVLADLLPEFAGGAGASAERWQRRRDELRTWWRTFLGSPQQRADTPPRCDVLAEERVEGVLRQLVAYESEPGWSTRAYLLRPERPTRPAPGVVVFHSTVPHSIRQPAGVEGRPEKAFGLKLARRGFVTFCPRNFLWPADSRLDAAGQTARLQRQWPNRKGMAKMLHDAQQAVDILAARPDVDATRLGALGHSLGAKEVLYLAAFDERVRATVSSEGGIGCRFSNWDAPWYLGPDIRRDGFGHDHHELLALIAPRPFLLIGGDSADGAPSWPYIQAAMPVYHALDNRPKLGLLNHGQGHAVPPVAESRALEWMEAYLGLAR
jgi:hypothetical protein